jgi:hypothetical protein
LSEAPASAARARGDGLIAVVLLAVVMAVYVASPTRQHFDSRYAIHTAISLLRGHLGDLTGMGDFDPASYTVIAIDGRWVTGYPLGVPLLLVPIVALLALVAPDTLAFIEASNSLGAHKVFASLITTAAVAVMYYALRARFSRATALFLAVAFAFGTSMWSTASRGLWQQGPLALAYAATLLCLLRARERPALVQWTGALLAFAYIVRPTAAIPVCVISGLVLLFHRRWLGWFLLWAALPAIGWFALNSAIYGAPLPPYYLPSHWGTVPIWGEGLFGVMVSPSRGLLVFTPFLLIAAPGVVAGWREASDRPVIAACVIIVAWHWLMLARFPVWWGGHSFGPRLMSDILPFLMLLVGYALEPPGLQRPRWRGAAIVLVAIAVAIHAQGALISAGYLWNVQPGNIDEQPARLWDWRDPQVLASLRAWRGLP